MFEKFFNKDKLVSLIKADTKEVSQEERFFSEVEDHADVKKLLSKILVSKENFNVNLQGPPACGKTMFLLAIKNNMKDCFFIDGTNATGAGTIDKLFAFPKTKYLLIDEIEKMKKPDQNQLLNLMETGTLTVTKVRKTQEMKFPGLKVFATSNNVDTMSKPLRSRFMELHLPEYTFEQFERIIVKLAQKRYKLDEEIGVKIADVVWNQMGTKDVRDGIQLAKLVRSVDDVEEMASIIHKYRRKPKVESEDEEE